MNNLTRTPHIHLLRAAESLPTGTLLPMFIHLPAGTLLLAFTLLLTAIPLQGQHTTDTIYSQYTPETFYSQHIPETVYSQYTTQTFYSQYISDTISDTEKERYRDLRHALMAAGNLSGDPGPQNIIWIDGGERYSYYRHDPFSGTRQIRVYSPADGTDEQIFNPADFTFPENDRRFDFRSFQWSADYRYLLFQTDFTPVYRYSGISDYYFFSIEDDALQLVAEDAFTAELSPDGGKVGIGRDGELFVYDLKEAEERQLTFDAGEDHLYNGRFGWVYEEEFGKVQAWEWSPDSRHIAYWQSDERHVKPFISTDYEGQYPEYTDIPYPKVGHDNPEVRIGVVEVETGDNRWMEFDPGDGYIPRIYWTADPEKLAIVYLNRAQTRLQLHLVDIRNGSGELIMEEVAAKGWIDIFDFFAGVDDLFRFPEDQEEFFWISDRDGWSHIYRYNYDGELLGKITSGDWEVTAIHAIDYDTETVWYESTEASPLERHLYSIGFDGSDKTRYSETPGRHQFNMGPNGRYYIDHFSNVDTPARVELRTTQNSGELLEVLADNQQVSRFIENQVYAPRELFTFTTSDGQELDGYLIRPVDFDPDESYPLLLNIYGGPSAQGVYNQFETNGWIQYLAQEGYVIANVNNRGSGGYGRDFEKVVYKNLGLYEARDFAESAKWLSGEHDWIDAGRMAIRGHSYGGYMAALTPLLHPGLFQVSIVAAPVTDWRLYDTIYTERYMGLLDENEEGYTESSVMTHAANLDAQMLVVHSSMDENVHIQNTMQMIRAFIDEGIDVDLRIYPPGAHGVAYNQASYFLLMETYTDYLDRFLKP